MSVQKLNFAIKPIDTPWEEEILTGQPKVVPVPGKPQQSFKRLSLKLGISDVMVASLAFLMWGYFHTTEGEKKAKARNELAHLLGDYQETYQVVGVQDHGMYVFAKNEKEATWARQSLVRADLKKTVKVINLLHEEARMASWLSEN